MLKLGEYSTFSDEEVMQDVVSGYEVDEGLVSKFEILVALLDYGSYEGSSYFILRDKATGVFYENVAGHCSCYGFEGQWEPKETTVTYLKSAHCPYGHEEQVKAFIETL